MASDAAKEDFQDYHNMWLFLQMIIILMGFSVEISILPVWFATETPLYLFPLHLLAISLTGFGFFLHERSLSRKSKLRAVCLYCFLLIVFFPVLGMIFSGFLYFGVRLTTRKSQDNLGEWEDEIFFDPTEKEDEQKFPLNLPERFQSEVSFESFVDIMHSSETLAKAKVIEKLSRRINGDSIKLLKAAVRDPTAEIRLYAAGVLLKIENQINGKIQKAISAVKTRGCAQTFNHLAGLYWQYATIGILDHFLSRYYLGLCAEAYGYALRLNGEQPDIMVAYGRCLVELGNLAEAKVSLQKASKKWPENYDMIFLRGEIDFKLGQFKRISTYLRSIHKPEELTEQQKQIFEFWGNKN